MSFSRIRDNLYAWSQKNLMNCNVKNCKLVRITKKRMPFLSDIKLNNNILEETSEFCDLGLVTSNRLSWNARVNKITNTANKILGLIKRTCKGLNDVATLRTLYCSLVRFPGAGEGARTAICGLYRYVPM